MGLSADEKKMLERLQRKAEQPDPPSVNKSLNVSVDLGDEKQVGLARRLFPGLFGDDDEGDTEIEDGSDEDDEQVADVPKRRGYYDK